MIFTDSDAERGREHVEEGELAITGDGVAVERDETDTVTE